MPDNDRMKIVFMGSRPLGIRCLKYLAKHTGAEIVGVVAYPEGHKGWWDGSVRDTAIELGLPLIEEKDVTNIDVDIVLSILYFRILKEPIISHPRYGCINLHQAELPRYRGCNSMSHAIMNARKDNYWKYGTTLHYIDKGVDTGPVIGIRFCEITEDDTAIALYKRIEETSYKFFIEMIPSILSTKGRLQSKPQGERMYYYPRTSLDNKEVDLNKNPEEIYDFVRALAFPPFEQAFIKIGDRKVYLSIE